MPRKINWTAITPVMPTSDAEMLLESLKTFKVTKSHLVSCGLCNHAAPHAMRVRLLVCNCQMCYAVMPCLWRGKTLACQHLNLMKVEEAGTHASHAPSPTRVRLSSAMKEVAREWAAQGLKPSRIRSGFLRRFNLDEASLPSLSQVQRFVHNYAASHLHNNDFLKSLRTKIREFAFTGDEDENQPFTFTPENDPSGRPIVGNGSDDSPFIVGVTSKTLLHRLDREPASFIFHLDATYKLSQAAYPVLVIGISDKARSFHPVAVVVMSQQKQFHHA